MDLKAGSRFRMTRELERLLLCGCARDRASREQRTDDGLGVLQSRGVDRRLVGVHRAERCIVVEAPN